MTPLGSAAVTATPDNATLSRILVQSSGVKLCLFAMSSSNSGCCADVHNKTVASGHF